MPKFFLTEKMKCVLAVMFLLVFAESVISDSLEDPSGWNSFFEMNSHEHMAAVDVVDPSGWNYVRSTKTSASHQQEDSMKQKVMFCKSFLEKENFQISSLSDESGVQLQKENFQISSLSDESGVQLQKENFQISSLSDESGVQLEKKIQIAVKAKVEHLGRQSPETSVKYIAFVKRFVNILLEAADLCDKKFDEEKYVSRYIEIRVSPEHLKTLTNFGKSDINVSMKELDSILTASVHYAHIPEFGIPELIDKIFFMASQKEIWLPLFLFFIVLGAFKLFKSSKTTTEFVKTIVLLIFIIGYVVEYYNMYKEAAIRQRLILEKHKDLPSSCNLDQSWWAFINLFSSSSYDDECRKYHKAALVDPLVEVSPISVLSSVLSDFVLHPFSKIGTAIAKFTSAVFGGLPFHLGIIAWIGSSIAIFVIIVLAVVILFGGSIAFRGWFGDVNVTRNCTSQAVSPPTEPAIEKPPAPVLPRVSASEPVLQAVSGLSNFVLMDANSLGALMLRAQSNVSLCPSGVQELKGPSTSSLPSESCREKIDLSRIQQKRLLSNVESNSCNCEISNAQEKTVHENLDRHVEERNDVKSMDSTVQEELLGTFEVIQSTETISSSGTQCKSDYK